MEGPPFKPVPLFAIALASLIFLIVAALEIRSPTCTAVRPEPVWVDVVFWGIAAVSFVAAFCGAFSFGIGQRWNPIASLLAALAFTAIWSGVGLYLLVGIVVGPCLG